MLHWLMVRAVLGRQSLCFAVHVAAVDQAVLQFAII